MHIVFITPEITPFSRSGQLGDVCAALPKALRGMGHKVSVISPLWSSVDPGARALARRLSTLNAELGGEVIECALYDGRTTGGVELAFIAHDRLFGQSAPAAGPGHDSDRQRIEAALVFCQAAAAHAAALEADVLHAHGFFAAPALCMAELKMPSTPRVLSLHDAAARGPVPHGELQTLAVPEPLATAIEGAGGELLGAGARCAQRCVAPSELEAATLRERPPFDAQPDALLGIPDALDSARWNPLTDAAIVARFDPIERSGKARCKDALQYEWELPVEPDVPVLLSFGLPHTGGNDDALALAEPILQNDVQLVIAEARAEGEAIHALSERFADRLVVIDDVDEAAEHRLIAGADLVLVHDVHPLRGDLHLRAQRYGALPVVRPSGAMADAVVDCDAALETGTGFVFDRADREEILATVRRALAAYAKREAFEALRQRVMQLDVSWERSARRYEHLYRSLQPQ